MIHESLKRHDVADPRAIGRRIRAARKSRGWRIRDLADAVGVKEPTVKCWESGSYVTKVTKMIRLCHALRRSMDWLVMGRGRNARHWN